MVQVPRVAVVGGGIAGTLCSLVLKNRGLHPTIIDAGRNGIGGRLRGGAQFLRVAPNNPKLGVVYSMLERQGLLRKWTGRFGVLGSAGGGFLPAEIVTSTGVGGMNKANSNARDDDDGTNKAMVGGRSAASDGGDFCHFADGSKAPTYVGVPSMADLCSNIGKMAKIEEVQGARVIGARTIEAGGWNLDIEHEGTIAEERQFDGLVLATHDPSFASGVVQSILEAEAAANGYATVDEATADNVSIVTRLKGLTDDLESVRSKGRMPVYQVMATYPGGFSEKIPFDAASVPGSHLVQFLTREASKPNNVEETNGGDEVWTAISTSQFAAGLLSQSSLSDADRRSEAAKVLGNEISHLLSPYTSESPLQVTAKRWGAAFTSTSLGLKEDSIALAPWRLAICGDFVRAMSEYSSPIEAAALSGLEAGERTASFFQQDDADSPLTQ